MSRKSLDSGSIVQPKTNAESCGRNELEIGGIARPGFVTKWVPFHQPKEPGRDLFLAWPVFFLTLRQLDKAAIARRLVLKAT
jgi:hypothetical protein